MVENKGKFGYAFSFFSRALTLELKSDAGRINHRSLVLAGVIVVVLILADGMTWIVRIVRPEAVGPPTSPVQLLAVWALFTFGCVFLIMRHEALTGPGRADEDP